MKEPKPRLNHALWGSVLIALAVAQPAFSQQSDKQGESTSVVRTKAGPVRGSHENGIRQFLGIPYAAPPVGDLRWRPPQTPATWREPKEATTFGNTCPQTNTLLTFAAKSDTEDCLYLNVFAPAASGHERPVMVWIYGGGLVDGESDDYDPAKLVTQGDLIVVTLNYRLNALGFFALPSLTEEHHAQANYGLMDQQFALQWVKANIAKFGGDPNNVTLFGESAGALSVLANMASSTATGLFQRAIVESPARGQKLRLNQPDLKTAEERGVALAKAVGCTTLDIACLRAKPIGEIQAAASSYSTSLVADGQVLARPLGESFDSGSFNKVPVLMGSNKDEGRFSIAYKELTSGQALTNDGYNEAVQKAYPDKTRAIEKHYPLTDYNSPGVALSAILSDSRIICPVHRLDEVLARSLPVYGYEFADRTAPFHFAPVSFPYGAAHTAELQYLFTGYRGASGESHRLNDLQQGLADTITGYWVAFARTGDPNGASRPEWPRYEQGNARFQLLRLPSPATVSGADYDTTHRCAIWSKTDDAGA